MRRQFAVERDFLHQRGLVVGLQVLFDGIQIKLELLVARQEIGLQELRAGLIAGMDKGVTASLVGRCQVQLFGVAEQVPVVPAEC